VVATVRGDGSWRKCSSRERLCDEEEEAGVAAADEELVLLCDRDRSARPRGKTRPVRADTCLTGRLPADRGGDCEVDREVDRSRRRESRSADILRAMPIVRVGSKSLICIGADESPTSRSKSSLVDNCCCC